MALVKKLTTRPPVIVITPIAMYAIGRQALSTTYEALYINASKARIRTRPLTATEIIFPYVSPKIVKAF